MQIPGIPGKKENQIKTLQTQTEFNKFYLYTWKSNSTHIYKNSQLENIKKAKDPIKNSNKEIKFLRINLTRNIQDL